MSIIPAANPAFWRAKLSELRSHYQRNERRRGTPANHAEIS